MDEPERRDIQDQLAYARGELAEMREELDLIREAMGRYIREWMVENAERDAGSLN